ncbi:NPCBM/NEW2 domain-containing protein [Deinococcus sp. D7000]|nr:NPCBM/NEW2 domain-containing protein [Deinococcus sp. D7000]
MSPIPSTASQTSMTKAARPLRWLVWCAPLILAACSGPSTPEEQVLTGGTPPAAQAPAEQDSMDDGGDYAWTDDGTDTKLSQESLKAGNNLLSNSAWTSATNGWGPIERNTSVGEAKANDGRPMSVNGKKYASGFGVHANSTMTFAIGGKCSTFISDVGIDDEVGNKGSVVFQVYADGVKLFDSGKMTGADAAKSIKVNIAGRKEVKLVVTDAGDKNTHDHADWGNPTLVDCTVAAKPSDPAPIPPTPVPVVPAPVPAPVVPAPVPIVPAPAPVPVVPAPAPKPATPSGPLVITKGGTYSGEYLSNDPAVAAIKIKTSEPVILENCTLRGRGHLIDASWTSANLTVRNCKGYGLNPNDRSRTPGRFLAAEGIVSLLIENNYMEKTAGIYVNQWQGNKGLPVSIIIRNNFARDIEGRYSDGNGGFQDKFYAVQFVQLNGMRDLSGAEIAWNRVENTARQSHVEDVINIYASNGTPSSPIRIHDNLINGAFAGRPDASYTGGGIMMGDGCGSGYTEATNNTVLETSNYGIAVAGGNHMKVAGNTILALGKLDDGTLLDADSDAGFYLRNYCKTSNDTSTVIAEGNTVGWTIPNSKNPHARWDWSVTAGVERNNAHIQAANRSVDPQLLALAVTDWERRAKAAGMVTGPR